VPSLDTLASGISHILEIRCCGSRQICYAYVPSLMGPRAYYSQVSKWRGRKKSNAVPPHPQDSVKCYCKELCLFANSQLSCQTASAPGNPGLRTPTTSNILIITAQGRQKGTKAPARSARGGRGRPAERVWRIAMNCGRVVEAHGGRRPADRPTGQEKYLNARPIRSRRPGGKCA